MNIYIPTIPDAEYTKDGKHKVLLTDFYFRIDGYSFAIKKGFTWDGASIPWVMRWKYGTPFDGVHLAGGLVHDAIYANAVYIPMQITPTYIPRRLANFTRLEADNIYYALIRKYGAVMLRAFKEWCAVRFCGRSHWYNYKKGKVMKNIMKILGALAASIVALVVLAGCKSIKFEKIERTPIIEGTNVVAFSEKIVRGEHSSYGTENNLEGFYLSASPTNGVLVKIERATSDMSKQHKEIIDASGTAIGTVAGAAAAAALK